MIFVNTALLEILLSCTISHWYLNMFSGEMLLISIILLMICYGWPTALIQKQHNTGCRLRVHVTVNFFHFHPCPLTPPSNPNSNLRIMVTSNNLHGISNYQSIEWSFNHLFRLTTKEHLWPLATWISNHIHYKVWDEITYPFLNFNGCTVEV